MPQQVLQPVAIQERMQTIDIIRGIALFGILIINFTVDYRDLDPWKERPILDQFIYWPITFLIDDRFRPIFCFLFGLGFSIQMLRAEARNSPFVLVYLRRLFILYLIGVANQILFTHDILRHYAMVGVFLLLLYKLPRKLLPGLALLFFFVSWSYNNFFSTWQKPGQFISNQIEIPVDSTALDHYVGVYEFETEPGRNIIVTREGPKLFAEGRSGKSQILPETEKDFFIRTLDIHFSFTKDSTGKPMSIVTRLQNGNRITSRRINMEIPQAQKEMVKQRADLAKKGRPSTYRQFLVKSANDFWLSLKNWSWKRFFWGGIIFRNTSSFFNGFILWAQKNFLYSNC